MTKTTPLFEPLTLRNRVVMAPMTTCSTCQSSVWRGRLIPSGVGTGADRCDWPQQSPAWSLLFSLEARSVQAFDVALRPMIRRRLGKPDCAGRRIRLPDGERLERQRPFRQSLLREAPP